MKYELHLLLSIVFLALLLRLNPVVPPDFIAAIFSCISMPAMYVLSYYANQGRFVSRRGFDVWREVEALAAGFATAFLVYVSLYGGSDIATFMMAFATAMFMRFAVRATCSYLEKRGLNVSRPLAATAVSLLIASVTYLLISVAV